MKLLFINAFKGLKKKKVQMLGIILMVMLSTGIYTAMSTSLDRLENRYYNYLIEQNVEDFSFIPVIDYDKDITIKNLENYNKKEFKNATKEEKIILTSYMNCLKNKCTLDEISKMNISNVFDKYGVSKIITKPKLDKVAKKYDFSYEREPSKLYSENKYTVKALPYKKDKKINKSYLVEGKMPISDNEITVMPKFAKANEINIGDIYKINNTEYKVVGYAYASDHVYPLISFNVPFFDEKYNNIMFMNENTYANFNGIIDNVYVGKFNYKTERETLLSMSTSIGPKDEVEKESTSTVGKIYEIEKDTIGFNFSVISRIMRIDMLSMELSTQRVFANTFLYLLLGIAVFIIVIITKKRIEDERLQIGVLKSLGYSSYKIATGYLVYPILGSIIGGLLGFLIGVSFNPTITNLFLSYFNVPLDGFKFNLDYFKIVVLVPLVILSILSYLISVFMLRKKPLDLLKEGSNLKVNIFSKLVNKLTKFLSFNYRFKYSLAFRSLGKLFIVAMTSFCTGLLLVLILVGMNLFNSIIDKTFSTYNFDYMVTYNQVMTSDDSNSDLLLDLGFKVEKAYDKNKNEIKLEEDNYDITLSGIDSEVKYMGIVDKKNKNLLPLLSSDDNIVINENIKEVLGVNIDDTLEVSYNNQKYSLKIVGVSEDYMGSTAYIDRANLTDMLKLPLGYNKKVTTDSKYSNMQNLGDEVKSINSILSLDELEANVRKQMDVANASIYIIIFFASFMALIIIGVIANIVVEENKKTISLMKVMGYKNSAISKIVLNIYTPAVIIAYLVSIPFMLYFLRKIIDGLVGDMNMAIPVSLSPLMAIIGLIGLLIAYYIAINLSRRVLNKVPLAVALKRE